MKDFAVVYYTTADVVPEITQPDVHVTASERWQCGGNEELTAAVQCEGHEHFDIPVVDALIAVSVDDLFNKIFTDTTFYAEFTQRRHTTGIRYLMTIN